MSWGLEHECSRKTHPTTWPGLWRQSLGLKHSFPATAAPSPSCPASSLAVGPMLPALAEAPWILQLKHLSSTSSGFQEGPGPHTVAQ